MAAPSSRKRTAVLVVHGMGSQRPLDTARGVVDAVWLEGDHTAQGKRRIWTHPELTGTDIDLPVITTNFVPNTDHRRIDFHELYWAHLMSETRAVAVLLWLFELARMGPRLKPSIKAIYWGAVVFLNLLILSVGLLAIQFIIQFIQPVANFAEVSHPLIGDFHSLVFVSSLIVIAAAGFAFIISLWKRAFKLAVWSLGITLLAVFTFAIADYFAPTDSPDAPTELLTNLFLPVFIAAIASKFTMGRWGIAGLAIAILLSAGAFLFVLTIFNSGWPSAAAYVSALSDGWLPWSITSFWSSVAAWLFIAIYLVLYASFLQPYLGDAARYFRDSPGNVAVRREIRRQAVATLEALHQSGDYDRIVVVAHSLGTVVAYDMLRAYYSRVNQSLPDLSKLGPDFDAVDRGTLAKPAAREKGREIIKRMAEEVEAARQRFAANKTAVGDKELRAWLVTDFVTMGSPLTHALYLMCRGYTEDELRADFDRRTREREFPTCPPRMPDNDRRLTFENPNDHVRSFHHGGQFALTRWTNLYFPVSQLFWGDAIGGEVGPVFRDPTSGSNIADVPVYANAAKRDDFFAHILYWNIDRPDRCKAPHIVALQKSIDLADTGEANGL